MTPTDTDLLVITSTAAQGSKSVDGSSSTLQRLRAALQGAWALALPAFTLVAAFSGIVQVVQAIKNREISVLFVSIILSLLGPAKPGRSFMSL
ncbi:MAG TPA: hypothetical protein VJT72_07345 [Pseudonocardiaceae bacterium]|nr:hypothetical protein [Pseudonocardiaceae bacterium]